MPDTVLRIPTALLPLMRSLLSDEAVRQRLLSTHKALGKMAAQLGEVSGE